MDNEVIEYIAHLEKYGIPASDSIHLCKFEQELKKDLKVGDIVKINTGKSCEYNRKKGFIGSVLVTPGFGSDPLVSGKFAVYFFNYNDKNFEGDFQGYELEPTGESVDPYYLREFIAKIKPKDLLYREMLQCMLAI